MFTPWKKPGNCFAAMLVGSLSLIPPVPVQGAFLKLGPFVFDAKTRVEAVATSNVEQERPSEATAEREDFYLVWGLDLTSTAEMMPNTRVNLSTGIAIEEHINRPDLNNSESPFGRFDAQVESNFDPLRLNAGVMFERTSESVDDKFIPVERRVPRKKRQVGDTLEYTAGAGWETKMLLLSADYSFSQERFDSEEFVEEEQDEETITYLAELLLSDFASISYQVEYTQTDLINVPGGRGEVERTETINLNFDQLFGLLERPKLTYSIGIQREYEDGESEGWELVHTFDVSDEWEFSPALRLSLFANYSIEDNPDEDDIALQFGATLTHEVSRRTAQIFDVTKEPAETFGSTEETDTTTYSYSLTVADFLIQNVTAAGSVNYEISQPPGNDMEETIWTYTLGLTHSVPINARLTRQLSYTYDLEDSNVEDELLEEHRVTLSFILQL